MLPPSGIIGNSFALSIWLLKCCKVELCHCKSRNLTVKYSDRFDLNPQVFEQVVAGVFSDFGYEVRVTSYSGDDGIDIAALDGEQGDTIGIQVKRYKDKIGAEQIRSFAGALVLNKHAQGVFVTTSKFTKGASRTANDFFDLGIPIKLWDCETLYEALQITQRPVYSTADDPKAPFSKIWKNPELTMTVCWSDGESH